MPKAVWNGSVIAESDSTVVVDGYHYFPAASVDLSLLQESDSRSRCFWKGTASYYDIVVDGKVNRDAAWHYPQPSDAASHIKDHIAFWRGVKIKG